MSAGPSAEAEAAAEAPPQPGEAEAAAEAPPQPGEAEATAETPATLRSVRVEGLRRTRRADLDRELRLGPGDHVTPSEIEAAVQRVRNTNLYAQVTWSVEDGVLLLEVTERWTLLPILQFARGGGVLNLTLGLYDLNTLGRRLEVGGLWELLGRTHSAALWVRDPRLFAGPVDARVELSLRNRVRVLYADDGRTAGGFLVERFLASFSGDYEWTPGLRTRALLRVEQDWYDLRYLPDDALAAQRAAGPPPDTFLPRVGIGVSLGQVDVDDFRLAGWRLDQELLLASPGWGADAAFLESQTALEAWRPVLGALVGGRAVVRLTRNAPAGHRTFLGGLDAVRGFTDSRFSGAHGWLLNLEARIPIVTGRWLVLQHVTFADGAGTADRLGDLGVLSGAAVGMGLRLMSPKLYRLVLRLDVAVPVHDGEGLELNLGGSQFF